MSRRARRRRAWGIGWALAAWTAGGVLAQPQPAAAPVIKCVRAPCIPPGDRGSTPLRPPVLTGLPAGGGIVVAPLARLRVSGALPGADIELDIAPTTSAHPDGLPGQARRLTVRADEAGAWTLHEPLDWDYPADATWLSRGARITVAQRQGQRASGTVTHRFQVMSAERAMVSPAWQPVLDFALAIWASPDFYLDPGRHARQLSPRLRVLLQREQRCAQQHGQCAIGADPWLAAQDGDMRDPVFQPAALGRVQSQVGVCYRFTLGGEEAGPQPRCASLNLLIDAHGQWTLDDLVSPDGTSLADMLFQHRYPS